LLALGHSFDDILNRAPHYMVLPSVVITDGSRTHGLG